MKFASSSALSTASPRLTESSFDSKTGILLKLRRLGSPIKRVRSYLTKYIDKVRTLSTVDGAIGNISAATVNSTRFERSYSVSDAYRIQLCLGSPRFGRQNLACPYSSLASVYMKRSTKSSITFYPLDFTPRELLHRDHSGILRLDRWSDTTLRCSPCSFRFPPLRRSPVLCPLALALLWPRIVACR